MPGRASLGRPGARAREPRPADAYGEGRRVWEPGSPLAGGAAPARAGERVRAAPCPGRGAGSRPRAEDTTRPVGDPLPLPRAYLRGRRCGQGIVQQLHLQLLRRRRCRGGRRFGHVALDHWRRVPGSRCQKPGTAARARAPQRRAMRPAARGAIRARAGLLRPAPAPATGAKGAGTGVAGRGRGRRQGGGASGREKVAATIALLPRGAGVSSDGTGPAPPAPAPRGAAPQAPGRAGTSRLPRAPFMGITIVAAAGGARLCPGPPRRRGSWARAKLPAPQGRGYPDPVQTFKAGPAPVPRQAPSPPAPARSVARGARGQRSTAFLLGFWGCSSHVSQCPESKGRGERGPVCILKGPARVRAGVGDVFGPSAKTPENSARQGQMVKGQPLLRQHNPGAFPTVRPEVQVPSKTPSCATLWYPCQGLPTSGLEAEI